MTKFKNRDMSGSKWNYVCTAQKPTVVTHSVTGNFTSASDRNLILG